MSDTYSYEVLEPGGHARLVGNVLDRISRASANPASAVGSAAAMLGDPETASWIKRTTAADGAALIEAVHGNTLRWNQLFNVAPATSTSNEVTFTVEDGSIVANGTATGLAIRNTAGQLTANHKYLYKGCPSGGSLSTYYAYVSGPDSGFIQRDTGDGVFFTALSSGSTNMIVAVTSGNTASNLKFTMQLFDLTAMFGSGNEPATVAEFEALYPEPYYPYDAGSLLPVRMEGVETVAADESWSSQLAIPVSTYFPDGMRSAGSVRDELRADAAVTRVGAVDLGTLTWTYSADYVRFSATLPSIGGPRTDLNWTCSLYTTSTDAYYDSNRQDMVITVDGSGVLVRNSAYTDAATFKSAMSGVMLHYALATPTTTPIDPPLPMSYHTGAGGTERVMVTSGTQSAPPVFVTRYPLDPTDLAASIAPRESAVAEANHAVGDLVMLGWTLCKVTTAIARGESITIGTNVTQTSVAAELAALS